MDNFEELICVICHDPLLEKPVVRTDCQCFAPANLYHEACISAWLRHDKNKRRSATNPHPYGTCPNCKSRVVGGSALYKQHDNLSGAKGVIDLTKREFNRCYFITITDDD